MSVTVDKQVHASEEKEDAALARAIETGRTTQRVTEQEVMAVLRQRDAG
ncbi:MAG: hypothetical protein OXR64_03275 [Chloroflexota bacterium]|nr:hypothetical protein [Chloroflexota bacterium]MDE2918845.1 hypothetical protein [Chloroflexota bacterium]